MKTKKFGIVNSDKNKVFDPGATLDKTQARDTRILYCKPWLSLLHT